MEKLVLWWRELGRRTRKEVLFNQFRGPFFGSRLCFLPLWLRWFMLGIGTILVVIAFIIYFFLVVEGLGTLFGYTVIK